MVSQQGRNRIYSMGGLGEWGSGLAGDRVKREIMWGEVAGIWGVAFVELKT